MHTSLPGLIKDFETLRKTQSEFVLATIVETEGSTYRKSGARMLITAAGECHGLLSGGCLEADLYEHAREVFSSRKPRSVFYDMRSGDDLIWGLGLGCDGAVRIRLEYLSPENGFAPLPLMQSALRNQVTSVVITIMESSHSQFLADSHYLYGAQGAGSMILPPELSDAAAEVLSCGKSSLRSLAIGGLSLQAFFGLVRPAPRLLIIGAGPDAPAVAEAAALLDWDVTVTDYREALCRADRFPDPSRVVHSKPESIRDHINVGGMDAAVLMTHKLEFDQRYLAQLVQNPPAYIGLLGPAARKQQLLQGLGDAAAELENRVYGPVGLDIGAELPEEIAVSLVAEVQSVLRGGQGGHLSHKADRPAVTAAPAPVDVPDLYAVVLAAGGSARFGALKQLLEFDGRSLLRQTTEKAGALLDDRVVVVHGPKASSCQRELAGMPVKHVVNENWETGMASSLRAGVGALPDQCRGVLILLCDQPLIETAHLGRLLDAWTEDTSRIVVAHYGDVHGVPAIIPRRCFDELLNLSGDSGARPLLDAHREELYTVPLEEAGLDIDTQADFEALLRGRLLSG
jgi:xanthine dehydrogenase accessory factor